MDPDDDALTLKFVFIPTTLFLSVPIRYYLRKWNRPISASAINGLLVATTVLVLRYTSLLKRDINSLWMNSVVLLCMYIPSYLFARMFRLDFYTFVQCLPAVLLLSTVGTMINCLTIATVIHILFNVPYSFSLLISCTLIPCESRHCISVLKDLTQIKYLCTILEAQTMMIMIVTVSIYDISIGFYAGIIVHTHQVIAIVFRSFACGLVVGFIIGKVSAVSLKLLYNDPVCLIVYTVGINYLIYIGTEFLMSCSGMLAVLINVISLIMNRNNLSPKVDETIVSFWHTLNYIIEIVIFMIALANVTYFFFIYSMKQVVVNVSLLYISILAIKIATSFLIYPFKQRLPYKITVKSILILGWCTGCNGVFSLLFLCALTEERDTGDEIEPLVPQIALVIFLGIIINNSMLKFLLFLIKQTRVSTARRVNMNSCMACMMESRTIIITILKMNRNFTNANWNTVRVNSNMMHPYGEELEEVSKTISEAIRDGVITCSECSYKIPYLLTEEEIDSLMSDSRMKILKAKKVSIIKQYQKGLIDRNCLFVLLTIVEAMMETDNKSCIMDLKKYLKTSRVSSIINTLLLSIDSSMAIHPPKQQLKRMLFFLIMHDAYDYITQCINMLDFVSVLLFLCGVNKDEGIFVIVVFGLMLLDLIIHLIGLSGDGFACAWRNYFKSLVNVFDMVFFILITPDFTYVIVHFVYKEQYGSMEVMYPLRALRLLRIFRLVFLFKMKHNFMIRRIKTGIDANICLAYELSNAVVRCCDEVIDVIDQLIEFAIIRNILHEQLVDERYNLLKIMAVIQKEKPLIAITSKTKQVIRIATIAMESTLDEMKAAGFVDSVEYNIVYAQVFEKQVMLRKMGFVEQNPPKVVFSEVSWMANEQEIIDYLYQCALVHSYDIGNIVINEGSIAPGITIIITGMLRIQYTPTDEKLKLMQQTGAIPIVDYASSATFDKRCSENIMSGSSVGELSMLTGRRSDCTIYAETPTDTFFLSTAVMKEAMKMNDNPIIGLEARLWKSCSISLAAVILSQSSNYQTFTSEQIKLKLSGAFMPNLKCYKVFMVTELMEDVVLIEGIISNSITNEIYIAPCLIPRNAKRLILPRSGLLDVDETTDCHLLIVPNESGQHYLIMHAEEEVAEIVSVPSSRCLLHTVQEQQIRDSKRRRTSKPSNVLTVVSRASMPHRATLQIEVLSETSTELDEDKYRTRRTK